MRQIVLYVGGGICKGGEMLESFLLCINLRPLFCLAVCHALQKIVLVPGFFPLAIGFLSQLHLCKSL
jgi:hypothetical protein